MSNLMRVYYGTDCLPYKDKERTVHYPIVGNSFLGSNNVTRVRFFIDRIGNYSDTWVANTKLPNGKLGNELLTTKNEEDGEHYVELALGSFYTQAKGDLYISLNALYGDMTIESSDGQYQINGNPYIQATGPVKIPVYYATPLISGEQVDEITLEKIYAEFGNKLDIDDPIYIRVVANINQINTPTYEKFLKDGDVVFDSHTGSYYQISGSYPTFTYTLLSTMVEDIDIQGQESIGAVSDIYFRDTSETLEKYIDDTIAEADDTYVTLTTVQEITGDKTLKGAKLKIANPSGTGMILQANNLGKLQVLGTNGAGKYVIDDAVIYPSANNMYDFGANSYQWKDIYLGQKLYLSNKHSLYDYNDFLRVNVGNTLSYEFRKTAFFPHNSNDLGLDTEMWRNLYLSGLVNKNTSGKGLKFPSTASITADKYLATEDYVGDYAYSKAEIDTKLTSMLVYKGTKEVSELNTLAGSLTTDNTGWFYNVSDSGILTWTESGETQTLEVLAGDNVCWTGSGWDKLTMDLSAYDDKFIAAGFFEVQAYNQTTGEITFVYSSDLYSMSYNGDTGVLTIEAN